MERSLNPNAKMEGVQPSGSCSKKTCHWGRDRATKEHPQGRRWAERQSTGQEYRPVVQEPGRQAKHPKEQKLSPYAWGVPQTTPRRVNGVWLPGPQHSTGRELDCLGRCLTLHSSRAGWGWRAENVEDPGSQVECLTDFKMNRKGFDLRVAFFWDSPGEILPWPQYL